MHAIHIKAFHNGCLFRILNRDNQLPAIATFGLQGDGEHPFYRSELPRESQFAGQTKRLEIREPIVSLQLQQAKRDREIKTRSFLPNVRWRKIDCDSLAARPAQRAVADGGCHAIFALLYRGIWKSDHGDLV